MTTQEQQLEFLHDMLEHCPSLVYVYDYTTQSNVYSNREVVSLLGYTSEEILAMGDNLFVTLMHPEDLARLPAHYAIMIASTTPNEVFTFEYRMRHRDGTWRWLVSRDSIFKRDENGAVTHFCGVCEDITERRNRFTWTENALSMVPNLIYVFDYPSQSNIYANQQITDQLGYSQEEVEAMGSNILQILIPEEDYNEVLSSMHPLILNASDEDVFSFQYRIRHKNGELRWLEDTVRVFLRGAEGEVLQYMGAIQDVTERKRNDIERNELQQRLIAAQQDAIRELATPVIPISDDTLVLPLIGSVDSQRAQLVLETLLEGVNDRRAERVILDITGVPVVDTQVAGTIMRAAQAVRLLGAEVILTGIRPEIAQTLVTLGTDFQGITTLSSLQRGIAYALGNK
jgi:rsbT co-antagonist protein RsbR